MATIESELKEHKIKTVCIGTVEETTLELHENVEVKIGKKDDRKTVRCKQVSGKVSINTGNGVEVFFPSFDELGYDGKESPKWKMALAMLDWNSKIKPKFPDEPATRVAVGGHLNYYYGYNENTKKAELKKSVRIDWANTRVTDNMKDGFTFEGDFYIVHTDVNDDTGVGTIKACYSDYHGRIRPVEITVDAGDADIVFNGTSDFEAVEAEQTRNLTVSHFRTSAEPVEEDGNARATFGSNRGSAPKVPTGHKFNDEYVLMSASSQPVPEPEEEEDDEGNPIESKSPWYNPRTVKKAIKAVAQEKEEIEKNPPAKKDKNAPKSGLQAAKAANKSSKSFGKGNAPTMTGFDDMDDLDDSLPF